jgi:hypothetical protein
MLVEVFSNAYAQRVNQATFKSTAGVAGSRCTPELAKMRKQESVNEP